MNSEKITCLLALIIFIAAGCAPGSGTPDATLDARIDNFAQTVTARAGSSGGGQDAAGTAIAQATAHSLEIQAAQTVQAAEDTAAAHATATFQAPAAAELPAYGVDPAGGTLAWVHQPVTLEIEGYRSEEFANDYIDVTAADFVLAADITWDTQYGASGCGFALRSDGEPEPSQYLVMLSRSANGHAYFLAQAEGQVANFRNFYANWLDPAFVWANGSANRLAVVAVGPNLNIYSNYHLLGEIDTTEPPPAKPNMPVEPVRPVRPGGKLGAEALQKYQNELAIYQLQLEAFNQLVNTIKRYQSAATKAFSETDTAFDDGFVGMFAFAYSGYVTCQFDNAWLWIINE